MIVAFHPPGAESQLEQEDGNAHQPAVGGAEVAMKGKSPMVIKHGADDALGDIIGETHASVGCQLLQEVLKPGAVISK